MTVEFILGLPTDHVEATQEFCTGPAIAEMARTAEALGYAGVFVTDHPAPPVSFLESGGHHTLEPTVALAAAATATTTLQLMTNLYITAYRNPFVAAKTLATLDTLAEGRLIVGTGAGYLEGEFAATGAPFDRRGEILDSHLDVMNAAWTGEPVTASGDGYEAVEIVSRPLPFPRSDGSRIPIWIGGNSRNALARAVRFGHGWIPMATPKGMERFVRTAAIRTTDDLRARADMLRSMWSQAGRSGRPVIAMEPWGVGRFGTDRWDRSAYRDALAELIDIGVSHAPVMISSIGRGFDQDRARFLRLAEGFLTDVS